MFAQRYSVGSTPTARVGADAPESGGYMSNGYTAFDPDEGYKRGHDNGYTEGYDSGAVRGEESTHN